MIKLQKLLYLSLFLLFFIGLIPAQASDRPGSITFPSMADPETCDGYRNEMLKLEKEKKTLLDEFNALINRFKNGELSLSDFLGQLTDFQTKISNNENSYQNVKKYYERDCLEEIVPDHEPAGEGMPCNSDNDCKLGLSCLIGVCAPSGGRPPESFVPTGGNVYIGDDLNIKEPATLP